MAYETFKILLADDDPVIRKLYGKSLRDQHYEVVLASDGQEALDLAFQELPDIVLLDIMMPRVDGYAVCAALRAAPATAETPIMILTALSGTAARQKAREVGADDFVTKGVSLESVEGRIKMLLKRRVLAHTRSWLAGLPGTVAADYALRSRREAGQPVAVCTYDIDGLQQINRLLGYEQGDRVLWRLARTLSAAVRRGNRGDFCGYAGADTFTLISTPERAEELVRAVIEAYAANGGQSGDMPTVSVAIVIVDGARAVHPAQVSELTRSLINEAKAAPGNSVRVGRL